MSKVEGNGAGNILLFEDDHLIAEDIQGVLTDSGYNIFNGFPEVVRELHGLPKRLNQVLNLLKIELVLIDINLCLAHDGIYIAEQINLLVDIPIIFVSVLADRGTIQRAQETRPYGFLLKPYSPIELRSLVDLALLSYRARQSQRSDFENKIGIWNITLTGQELTTSFSWLRKFGLEDIKIRTPEDFLRIVHPDERKVVTGMFEILKRKQLFIKDFEYRILSATGDYRWILSEIADSAKVNDDVFNYVIINRDSTHHRNTQDNLRYHSTHDFLTGLLNRAAFMNELRSRLAGIKAGEGNFAVVFSDIDKFKAVNDTCGHHTGDLLLKKIAQRFQNAIKEHDILARFGGDEFVFILKDIDRIEDLHIVAHRIIETLNTPILINGVSFPISVSLGVAVAGSSAMDGEELLRNADTAMYEAKKDSGISYRIFEESEKARVFARLRIEEALKKAIKQNEFVTYFRPMLGRDSRTIFGLGVTVKWRNSRFGMLNLAEYSSIMEETGLAVPITIKILEETSVLISEWKSKGLKNMLVIVDISERFMELKDWERIVLLYLNLERIDAESIILKIQESAFLKDVPRNTEIIKILRDLKFGVCIQLHSRSGLLPFLNTVACNYLEISGLNLPADFRGKSFSAFAKIIHSLRKKLIVGEAVRGIAGPGDHYDFYYLSKPISLRRIESLLLNHTLRPARKIKIQVKEII